MTTAGTMPETATESICSVVQPASFTSLGMTVHKASHHCSVSASDQPIWSLKRFIGSPATATMPLSTSSSMAFNPEEPISIPRMRSAISLGTPSCVNKSLCPFWVDFIPCIAIALKVTSYDATVSKLKELFDSS